MKKLKLETIKKLEELKSNFSYDMEENYKNMVNIMIDYDNEAQDDLYLYDTTLQLIEFVDEETFKYYIEYQFKEFGMCRAPYIFRSLEYSDSIYKIDAYGNLQNVDTEDFTYCIDEAIKKLSEV